MPVHERQGELANDNSKAGLSGHMNWGRIERSPRPAAYAAGTNYAIGARVSHGDTEYEASGASGPGNGGAVTPGTNPAKWVELPGAEQYEPGGVLGDIFDPAVNDAS